MNRPGSFFIEFLKTCKSKPLDTTISIALAKSDYPVLALIIPQLNHDNAIFISWLHFTLKQMGIQKLKPQLTVYPAIPHERLFRTLFGDNAIDEIYKE